jgi:hypothetical protein
MTLPTSIGGFQHLIPEETTKDGDIEVCDGKPHCWATPGHRVGDYEHTHWCNVYRKIPVAKQGGDPQIWTAEEAGIRGNTTPLVIAQTYNGPARSDSSLPTGAKERKRIPIYSGFLRYFPRAVAAVAELSLIGNDQHNPGKPLHWDRSKSGDEHDALCRHLLEAGKLDSDGVRHSTKLCWRALAALEKELEEAAK